VSEIPELDRLIEESEIVRSNIKTRKRDMMFKTSMLRLILIFPLFFVLCLVFGPSLGIQVTCAYFFIILIPPLLEAYNDLVGGLLKDDWEGRDMTKRYSSK